jgi:hypothetical protein
MARSDAVLYAVVVLAWLAIRRPRRTALAVGAPFVVIAASWTAAQWAMTGHPFPSTLAAKLAQRDSGIFGTQWTFLQMLPVHGVVGGDGGSVGWVVLFGFIGLVLLGVAVSATVAAFRQRKVAVPWLAVAAVVVVLEYGVVFRMPGYYWHYGPFMLWVVTGAAVGLEAVVRRRRLVSASIVAVVALVASVLGAQGHPQGLMEAHTHYREVAEWIDRDSHAAHPTVAVDEIGTIGYYSRTDIVDYMGLLDARAVGPVRRGDFTWWCLNGPTTGSRHRPSPTTPRR